MKRLVVAASLFVIFATVLFARGEHPLAGEPAPDFALKDLNGKTVRLSDLRGKAVVVNFWATWCPPCRHEVPWFVDLQKEYGSAGLQIVGVSMDQGGKLPVKGFADQFEINYPIVMADGAIARNYGGIRSLPMTFYIGRDGKIIDAVPGLISRDAIERRIRTALATKQK